MFPPVVPLVLRSDAAGSGKFRAPRGDHMHRGLDLRAEPGQPVVAPEDFFRIERIGYPYSDDLSYRIVIGQGGSGLLWRFFYVQPRVDVGTVLAAGELLGVAQDVAARYHGRPMKNHIHVEVLLSGRGMMMSDGAHPEKIWLNPESVLAIGGLRLGVK